MKNSLLDFIEKNKLLEVAGKQFCIIFLLLFLTATSSRGQVKMKIEPYQLTASDTLKIEIKNYSKKKGYYNIAWQFLENQKWKFLRTDIFNNFPMAYVFQKIEPNIVVKKYFVIDTIFTRIFKSYKFLRCRLVLTYSYSSKLEPKILYYSKDFIVNRKL
jgi:hypothetical protein